MAASLSGSGASRAGEYIERIARARRAAACGSARRMIFRRHRRRAHEHRRAACSPSCSRSCFQSGWCAYSARPRAAGSTTRPCSRSSGADLAHLAADGADADALHLGADDAVRAYRDSEMVVWHASGQSLLSWLGPVLRFAAPIILLSRSLSWCHPGPPADRRGSRQRFSSGATTSARSRRGASSSRAARERVFFVESVDFEGSASAQRLRQHRSQGKDGVIVAAEGRDRDGAERRTLSSCSNTAGATKARPGSAEYRTLEFDRYALRIDSPAGCAARGAQRAHTADAELLANRRPVHPRRAACGASGFRSSRWW